MVSQYNEGKLEFIGRKLVSVDQDVTCKCDCIVQPKVRSLYYIIFYFNRFVNIIFLFIGL